MKKTLLFLLIAAAIVFPTTGFAVILPGYSGGDGSAVSPFQIATLEDLQMLSETPEHWGSEFHFIQTATISLTPDFDRAEGQTANMKPIGHGENLQFSAHYNGNGQVINNLSYHAPWTTDEDGIKIMPQNFYTTSDYDSFGLFTNTNGATIENLNLVKVSILLEISEPLNSNVGGLIGFDFGNTTITNCSMSGEVTGHAYVGGLIGKSSPSINPSANATEISDCYLKLENLHAMKYAGGVAGYGAGIKIEETAMVGSNARHGRISGCQRIGGFVGFASSTAIKNCYSMNNIDVIDLPHAEYIGGFIGELLGGEVENCYTDGKTITEYNTEDTRFGGFLGNNDVNNEIHIVNSFFNESKTEKTESNGGSGLTEEEITKPDVFVHNNWDFNGVWNVNLDGKPSLKIFGAVADLECEPLDYLWIGVPNAENLTTSWATAAAWSGGKVPSQAKSVYIPSSIYSASSCVVDVATAECMTISISKENPLNILSGESGSGQLYVRNSAMGQVTYNLIVPEAAGVDMGKKGWHYIASPVVGQSITDFVLNPDNNILTKQNIDHTMYALGVYDNELQREVFVKADGTEGDFLPGIGYAICRNTCSDGVVTFTGEINTDNVTVYSPAPENEEAWTILGNPYTTAIDGDVLMSSIDNQLCEICRAIYIIDKETDTYIPFNRATGVGPLAPCQGFHIHVASKGSSVTFSPEWRADRNDRSDSQFKSASMDEEKYFVDLQVSNVIATGEGSTTEELKKSTAIYFIEGNSNGLDVGYDAAQFEGNMSKDLCLSTTLVDDMVYDDKFQIQTLNSEDVYSSSIPLVLSINDQDIQFDESEVSFSIKEQDLPSGVEVFLQDKVTGFEKKITTEESYTFTATPSDEPIEDRFVLNLKVATSATLLDKENIQIVAQPLNNNILVKGEIATGTEMKIYSVSGQIVHSQELDASVNANVVVGSEMIPGIYIVTLKKNGSVYNQKIKW